MRADGLTESPRGILEALGFGRPPEVLLNGRMVFGGPGYTVRKLAQKHYGDEEKRTIIHQTNRGYLNISDPGIREKCLPLI